MRAAGHLSVALVILCAGLASCGQASSVGAGQDRWRCPEGLEGTAITLSISVADQEKPAIQRLLSRFQGRCRGGLNLGQLVRFRRPLGPRVSLRTDLDAEQLGHQVARDSNTRTPTIHLFAQDNVRLYDLVSQGLVQRLGKQGGEPQPETYSNVPTGAQEYFLPFRPNVRLTYGRKDSLQRAGVHELPPTINGLVSAGKALRMSPSKAGITMSLARGDAAAVTVSELILSHGGDPVKLNDAGWQGAFKFLQELWKNDVLAQESVSARWDTEVDNLKTGVAALAQNWSFTSAALGRDLHKFWVGSGWAGPAAEGHVVGGDVLGMPKGVSGKQRKAAVALAGFLMSREAQEELAIANGWPSILKSVSPKGQRRSIEAALQCGWIRPSIPEWPDVTTAMNEAVNRIVFRTEPVNDVLEELVGRYPRLATLSTSHRDCDTQ